MSLPPALSPAAEHVIHESSTDLRSSLLDVVASAKQCLIVASPFWDAGTTEEMVTLVRKKLLSGVHFKAISADRGQRAYLGSANMTVLSLRSRMELGVILGGAAASQLDRILRVVLTRAAPDKDELASDFYVATFC